MQATADHIAEFATRPFADVECDMEDRFDPLAKLTTTMSSGWKSVHYNHIEGFEYAPVEMHEILLEHMRDERAIPTLEKQAQCFRIIKSMLGEYWAMEWEAQS